jgi:uncharacterized membrane protein
MYSKAKIAGHPVHPMLVGFPVASYVATFAALIAYQITGGAFWFRVAIVANVAGVATAALAAIPGAVDFLFGIPRHTRAAATALTHALLNVGALALFVINLVVIRQGWSGPVEHASLAVGLSLLGVLATVGAGWFGWKLVQTHHVGVEPLGGRDLAEAEQERLQTSVRHPPMTPRPH